MSAAEATTPRAVAGIRPVRRPSAAVPALGAAADLPPPAQPDRACWSWPPCPIFIAIAVKTTASSPGDDAPDFFRSITENGLFVALSALTIELGLFLPLAIAVIAGDSVAGRGQRRHPALPAHRAGRAAAAAGRQVRRPRRLRLRGDPHGDGHRDGHRAGAVRRRRPHHPLRAPRSPSPTASSGCWGPRPTSRCAWPRSARSGCSSRRSPSSPSPRRSRPSSSARPASSSTRSRRSSWLHPYLITHHWMAFGDLLRAPSRLGRARSRALRRGGLRRGVLPRGLGTLRRQGRHQLNLGDFPACWSGRGHAHTTT